MSSSLPHCRDVDALPSTRIPAPCHGLQKSDRHAFRLCHGVAAILRAPCADLANLTFMTAAVGAIGMVPDTRGKQLYGNDAKYMVHAGAPSVGLWQEPRQLAAALISVAHRIHVRRYVEIGIYTAWSTCTIAAYLARVGGGLDGFEGHGLDVTTKYLTNSTRALLSYLRVDLTIRTERGGIESLSTGALTPLAHPAFDLCFIDADHSYEGVRADYVAMAPSCRVIMHHDIQDVTCLSIAGYSAEAHTADS